MRCRHAAIVALALLGTGCDRAPRDVRIELGLPRAIGCRPTAVQSVEVRALGDVPAAEPNVIVLDPAAGAQTVERFPDRTELVAVEGRGAIGPDPWIGGGVATIAEGSDVQAVTLLRYGRSCPLADSSARVPEGAAVAALSDGRLWIAGGQEDGRVLESIVSIRPGDPLATRSEARLFVERTGASATALGELVVIAGGSSAIDGPGEDTLEIVNVAEDARAGDGFLAVARREHAAIAIGARELIVIGGRDLAGGAPLAEIELVTVEGSGASAASELVARLEVARAGATALRLDDGRVAIAGGVDARDAPVDVVELFDPAERAITSTHTVPARDRAAYAALPGERIAQLGGQREGAWTGEVDVLVRGEVVSLGDVLPALEEPRAVALADGRVLVIGRDGATRRARGVVLDVGSGEVSAIEASRAATVLLTLADGSIAEGDGDGLSALRVDLRTPLDSPPATLVPALIEDRASLAIDAPGRWRAEGGAWVAQVDDARFDLPGLRFASFELVLDASGVVEVLLVDGAAPPIAIELAQDAARLGECRAPRADDAPVRIVRADGRITLEAGLGAVDCTSALAARVGVAVRARRGAAVRSVSIARR